jgi:hypothetical protein
MNTSEILDKIQEIRAKNNQNWMDLIRIAFKSSPEEAKKVFAKIIEEDEKISEECKKMLEDEISDEELTEILCNLFVVLNSRGYWDSYATGWEDTENILKAFFYTSGQLKHYGVKKGDNKIFSVFSMLSHMPKKKMIKLLNEKNIII